MELGYVAGYAEMVLPLLVEEAEFVVVKKETREATVLGV